MNRRTRKELLLALLLALGGCATAGPTPEQSDALGKAVERVANGTAQQATGAAGRQASRDVFTGLGGGLTSQIGSATVSNVTREYPALVECTMMMNDLSFVAAATFDLGIPLWLFALLVPVLIALMVLDYQLGEASEKAFDKKQAAKRSGR